GRTLGRGSRRPRPPAPCRAVAGRPATRPRARRCRFHRPPPGLSRALGRGAPWPGAACGGSPTRSHSERSRAGVAVGAPTAPAYGLRRGTRPRTTAGAVCGCHARPSLRGRRSDAHRPCTARALAAGARMPRHVGSADRGIPRATDIQSDTDGTQLRRGTALETGPTSSESPAVPHGNATGGGVRSQPDKHDYGYQRGGTSRTSAVTTPKGVTVTRTSVREYLARQRELISPAVAIRPQPLVDKIPVRHQPQDRESVWPDCPALGARAGRSSDRIAHAGPRPGAHPSRSVHGRGIMRACTAGRVVLSALSFILASTPALAQSPPSGLI